MDPDSPTLEDVLEIHRRVIAQFGGPPGVRNMDALEAAVARPHSGFGGTAFYDTLSEKAAALAHSIATSHPFLDGNKRVAYAVAAFYLRLYGHHLDVTAAQIEETGVARGARRPRD